MSEKVTVSRVSDPRMSTGELIQPQKGCGQTPKKIPMFDGFWSPIHIGKYVPKNWHLEDKPSP
jgi:hypothetical protein